MEHNSKKNHGCRHAFFYLENAFINEDYQFISFWLWLFIDTLYS